MRSVTSAQSVGEMHNNQHAVYFGGLSGLKTVGAKMGWAASLIADGRLASVVPCRR
jgi:hypothetical protein